MAQDNLGSKECLSIALGGMIGGGIFAVLGVVAQIVHAATWFAFLLAGIVALCAGYSYNKLNNISPNTGGSVSLIQGCTGRTKLAGMAGWNSAVWIYRFHGHVCLCIQQFCLRIRHTAQNRPGPADAPGGGGVDYPPVHGN